MRAGIKAAREERDAAHLAFQQTVMRAVGEVETRLQSYNAAFETRREMEAAGAQVRRTVRVAESAYDSGVVSEGAVFKAKIALAEMNSRMVQAQTDVLIALVALNKALGGGWPLPEKDEN